MAKKVKKKARSGHTEKRVSTLPQKTEPVAQQSIPSTDDGFSIIKERKVCSHLDKGIDLAKFSSRIRGKQVKKKGGGSVDKKPESKAIWVCLECGHLSCGEIGFPTTPQTHAVQHARQTLEKLEESGEQKGPLSDIVKLVKGRSFQGGSVDVEDVYFGSGSVISEIKSENTIVSSLDGKSGYVVKGLVNIEGYQQHDSHELLRCLLDGLCAEELNARKQTTSLENGISSNLGPTFVDGIFGGQLSSTVSCLECGHSSTVFKPFLDLSLQYQLRNPHLKGPNLFLEPRNQSCLQNEVEGFVQSLIGMQIL
ncbi:unnamed protein product [Camellia sinensis]